MFFCLVNLDIWSITSVVLTFYMKRDHTPVLASDKGVLPSISSEGLSDWQAVGLPNGHIGEPLLWENMDLNSIPQPAALNVLLIDFKLKCSSMFLNNLKPKKSIYCHHF